jgi:energy-coupling factor transport system permease protein
MSMGSYFPGDTLIHRWDPRTKIILAATFLIAAFLVEGIAALFFLQASVLCLAYLAGNGLALFLRGIRPLLWFSLFVATANLFFAGGAPLAEQGLLHYLSLEGISLAARMFMRLCILASSASLLTVSTTPLSLSDGLERLLQPMRRLGLPVQEIAMMIAISFRFMPTILEEGRRIIAAQSSRRPDLFAGSPARRWKACIPFIIPLLVGSLRRGNDLAMAMEARCYGGGGARTRMREIEFSRADLGAAVMMGSVLAVLAILEHATF